MPAARFRAEAAFLDTHLGTGVKIDRARQTMVIGTADQEASHHLKLALNASTAEARCVVTDDTGVAIHVADIIDRGD